MVKGMSKPNAPKDDNEIERHVLEKYEVQSKLGKVSSSLNHKTKVIHAYCVQGAYGVVYKAIDKNRNTVALKKCFDAFR